jgi:hypothetical protein
MLLSLTVFDLYDLDHQNGRNGGATNPLSAATKKQFPSGAF